MLGRKGVNNLFWITIFFAFLVTGQASANEPVSYMGSSIILKTFFQDASKAFTAKTGIPVTSKAEMTPAGILGLLNGQCNLAGGGRPLKEDEKSRGLNELAFAKNIVAIFVHKSNPVQNLTSDQLKKIYAGEITNWKEVGGADQPILIVIDPKKSQHRVQFTKAIMGDSEITTKGFTVQKPPQTVGKVASFPPAISFTALGLVTKNSDVKALSIDGVEPTPENVANGTYKIVMTMYFYTKGAPAGSAKQMIEFLQSPEGRKIIGTGGMFAL
ncbi:MAG: phosphate ABC transporter substrate-binding protein [Desulfobulbaceae bacterium]|nr:phosphate ABC transporter substrate-binding protein [Desulfobulbaceae bacterium]HIJ78934.1 phosphate ABC transporter substrate-binding protein [Deltaproteobacteria bacterium]